MLATVNPIPLKSVRQLAPELLAGDKIQPGHVLFGIIWINPARVSGTPCFYATRVPVKILFDYIGAEETLDQFLDDFEGVDRAQALAVLDLAGKDLLSDLGSL